MKNFKRMMLTVVLTGIVVGCSSMGNQLDKISKGMSKADYRVTLYSGGFPVKEWIVRDGYINTESNSDGYYWIDANGRLVRVSGDVLIQEIGEDE